ncbi:type III pantothenate kinase [Alteribacter natronophilus]|uniref:type III pantothenate kinase n=1 Tax=Alteribacter natronophilus TaxID=2583810 RepID=UPI00110DADBF|nr:type III pantothenate kinase [Alteribacter natronophilus]TMW69938.1 type III pantothenate kinase [Alteribacter natronophilus]
MIAVMDAGNTNIMIGVYDGDRLLYDWRIGTDPKKSEDEYAMLIGGLFSHAGLSFNQIEGVMISSVAPPVMYSLVEMCRSYIGTEPKLVGPGVKTGLNIKYDNPKEVGADRIANAVAGTARYGSPLIIVDFGTATTFCFINGKGQYEGGTITPGVKIATEALYTYASKLPRVELARPEGVVGKTTVESMQAGIFHGSIGQVEGIVRAIKKETGTRPRVVATGGLCELIGPEAPSVDEVDPYLTLEGLRLIYEKNRN